MFTKANLIPNQMTDDRVTVLKVNELIQIFLYWEILAKCIVLYFKFKGAKLKNECCSKLAVDDCLFLQSVKPSETWSVYISSNLSTKS